MVRHESLFETSGSIWRPWGTMRSKPSLSLWLSATALLLVVACSDSGTDSGVPGSVPAALGREAPLSVYVVNYPLEYFAERIGGDRVEVVLPSPAGIDPADWSPEVETISAYQKADLILLNGAGYAAWVERATLPQTRIVDTSSAFRDQLLELQGTTTHSHGPAGEHSHRGFAATTWLDPSLAIAQASAIAEAFVDASPSGQAAFEAGLASLVADLRNLDGELDAAAARLHARPLVFSHPVYQYLASRYGLDARSVHWEPGDSPTEEQWDELEALLGEHPSTVMIWESEPLAATRARLETLGLRVIVYDPCGSRPDDGDFLDVMGRNMKALRELGFR